MAQYGLTDEQELIRGMVAEFASSKVAPRAEAIDHEARFPRDLLDAMGGLGLLGILAPSDAGGAGADTVSYVAAVEELAKASASVALLSSVQNALAVLPVATHASPGARSRLLRDLSGGAKLGTLAAHESDAGSDLSAVRCKAEKGPGDGFVLTGSKSYVIAAGEADVYLVLAREDGLKEPSLFVAERGPGMTFSHPEDLLGVRGTSTGQVFLKRVPASADARLGGPGQGLAVVRDAMAVHRLGIGALAVGVSQAAVDAAVAFADERTQFDKKIREFSAIQSKLAEIASETRAGRLLVRSAAALRDQGQPFEVEGEMAKVFIAEAAKRVTREAIKVHGGSGYMKEYKVERFNRDARVASLLAGTTEVLRGRIAASFYTT
ncbi:MAG: acyl-CoA dehydrogenase family protein [Methanobacteriota archaeon]